MTDGPVAPGDSLPLFGGPYPGYTASAEAGQTDKDDLVKRHLASFKEQVEAAQEFSPTSITAHSLKVEKLSFLRMKTWKNYLEHSL